jgi:phosphoglycerol transferase MdoB-like AlkP superfamily enzyme
MKNFYANGFRTEHGLIAVLSGFPAQPKTSIIRNFGKFDHLHSLAKELAPLGYASTAYYGANLDFANTGPYLHAAGFSKVLGEKDIPYKDRAVWGCWDEDLFSFMQKDLPKLKQPFISCALTITSHEPFSKPPGPIVFKGDGWDQRYRNTVHYTDKCLGDFIQNASKTDWYKNTLFVVLADHSHALPRGRNFNETQRFRIPCLLLGGVLKPEYRGKTIDKMACQQDLIATLLGQLSLKNAHFPWSRDLFNPNTKGFAYFTFEDGFGLIDERGQVVFDNEQKHTVTLSGEPAAAVKEEMLRTGKAIQQEVQDEYLAY